jgi:hypothetical protein
VEPSYSEIANEQLDQVLVTGDTGLYNALVTVCEFILDNPATAQRDSAAITTNVGIRLRYAVPGHAPYKVFWASEGPTIEAVFPYPT